MTAGERLNRSYEQWLAVVNAGGIAPPVVTDQACAMFYLGAQMAMGALSEAANIGAPGSNVNITEAYDDLVKTISANLENASDILLDRSCGKPGDGAQ